MRKTLQMIKRFSFPLLISLLLLSCATSSIWKMQEERMLKDFKEGDYLGAYNIAVLVLEHASEEEKIKTLRFIKENPALLKAGYEDLTDSIKKYYENRLYHNARGISEKYGNLKRVATSAMMQDVQKEFSALLQFLEKISESDLFSIPRIEDMNQQDIEASKRIAFNQLIKVVQQGTSNLEEDNILEDSIKETGLDSDKAFKEILYENRDAIIKSGVAYLRKHLFVRFPELGQTEIEKHLINVFLAASDEDYKLSRYLHEKFGKICLINLCNEPAQNIHYTLNLKRIKFESGPPQETTEEVLVPWSDFTLMARLCYPDRATAIYTRYRGTGVVKYAYRVDLLKGDQKVFSKIFDGRVADSYQYASNLRYRNLLGGIGVPYVAPNNAVKQELIFSAKPNISEEGLITEAFSEIYGEICKIPELTLTLTEIGPSLLIKIDPPACRRNLCSPI